MGQDKGSMIIQGQPMIKYILSTLNNEIDEALIVLNDSNRIEKYGEFINPDDYSYEIRFIEDKIKNKGPISGILTGLENIRSEYAIVFPCDSPYVSENTVRTLFSEIEENKQIVNVRKLVQNLIRKAGEAVAIHVILEKQEKV